MDQAALLFFEGHPNALAVYAVLEEKLLTMAPESVVRVQKTQIGFSAPLLYAVAWLPRRKADGDVLLLSFCLPYRLTCCRIWQVAEPYPGRFMHHLFVRAPRELDGEVTGWLREALTFAGRKRGK